MHNPRGGTDFIEALQLAIEGKLAEVWTALPAFIVSFDPSKRTCVVQPTIQASRQGEDGHTTWETFPVLTDVLVQFPGGGGFVLTFPLAAGDEGIVIFSARCLDAWWERGGIQVQAEQRMFDLSDGIFIPTIRSAPNVEVGISTTGVELRNDAGTSYVRIGAAGNISVVTPGNVTVTAGGVLSLTAANINLTGILTINGEAYTAHRHSGVQTGGGNTGGKV